MDLDLLIRLLTLVGLFAMMLAMGLKVTPAEVVASCRRLRLVFWGLAANYALVPLATIALLRVFEANPMVSLGFLILAVCPGAPLGPPFAAIAKGNVAHATGMMVLLAGLSAVLSPVLLKALCDALLPGTALEIDYFAIVRTLLVSQILPLGAGLAMHHAAQKLSSRLVKPLSFLANVLLLAVIVLLLANEFDTLRMIRGRGWLGMLLLLALSLGIGWLCGGPSLATRKSLSVTTGVRNAAVALVIVSTSFAGTPAVTAVVAYAFLSVFGTLGFAFLFALIPENQSPHRLNSTTPAELESTAT